MNLNIVKGLPVPLMGHYTVWYNIKTKKYVFRKYENFPSIIRIEFHKENPRFPNHAERWLLEELIQKILRESYYYNFDAPNHMGRYLLDELEGTCERDTKGFGREWFKLDNGRNFLFITKTNCVMDALQDQLKDGDAEAINILSEETCFEDVVLNMLNEMLTKTEGKSNIVL